jgi:hypothetical protein
MTKQDNKTDKPKNKGGRPKKTIDHAQLKKIMTVNPSKTQIAAYFEMKLDTLNRIVKEDQEISDIIERGYENAKLTLRKLQWQAAYEGKVPMLIWLGKQWLGQTEKQEVTAHNTNVEVSKSDEEIISDFINKAPKASKEENRIN